MTGRVSSSGAGAPMGGVMSENLSDTDRRILKLAARGLTPASIARKIGRPTAEGEGRVRLALAKAGVKPREADREGAQVLPAPADR